MIVTEQAVSYGDFQLLQGPASNYPFRTLRAQLAPDPQVYQLRNLPVMELAARATVACFLGEVASRHHNVVKFLHRSKLPVVHGSESGKQVFLYHIVEAIDGRLDYEDLQEEFPELTQVDLALALGFLRDVAQFNLQGVDVGSLEDSFIESNPAFQASVIAAMSEAESDYVPITSDANRA